jgi:hypothetical protein
VNPSYKTVKIPMWAYDNALVARNELLRRGLDALPAELRELSRCPLCRSNVRRVEDDELQRVECGCGYKQATMGENGSTVGIGVLLGLGLTALLERLPLDEAAVARARARAAFRVGMKRMQRRAVETGASKMTMRKINAEIKAARAERHARLERERLATVSPPTAARRRRSS